MIPGGPAAEIRANPPLEAGVVEGTLARLRQACDAAIRRARTAGRPAVAWVATQLSPVDPVGVFARWRSVGTEATLWLRPDDRFALVAGGRSWIADTSGAQRFQDADAAWRDLVALADGGDSDFSGPIAMAGFSFAPERPGGEWEGFPSGSVVLPRVAMVRDGDRFRLIVAVVVGPEGRHLVDAEEEVRALLEVAVEPWRPAPATSETDRGLVLEESPSPEEWMTAVRSAAAAVRNGSLEKVVLARAVRARRASLDPDSILRRLVSDYPACTVFAISRGARTFLGATPERLVRLRGREVSVAAVAGSAARGQAAEEDARLGEELLISGKDWIEHAVVVESLRRALNAVCASVTIDPAPTLLKVRNVQHLHTALSGTLRDRMTVLELAGRLHPTPAVGGVPRGDALRWIQEHEGLERGWYAGPVGWINGAGEGEFAVAIRSALICGDEALLFAGCGIVADSKPEQEHAESWLKLRSVLSALDRR